MIVAFNSGLSTQLKNFAAKAKKSYYLVSSPLKKNSENVTASALATGGFMETVAGLTVAPFSEMPVGVGVGISSDVIVPDLEGAMDKEEAMSQISCSIDTPDECVACGS